jgi:hypothetical protein
VLNLDQAATNSYYQPTQIGQPATLPPSGSRLLAQLTKYTPAASTAVANSTPTTLVNATPAPTGPQVVRAQLAASSRQLAAVLDASWQQYLALPAEVYAGDRAPSADSLRLALERFNAVATDARYRSLAQRAEFRNTLSLLSQYHAAIQSVTSQPLSLPPPPR